MTFKEIFIKTIVDKTEYEIRLKADPKNGFYTYFTDEAGYAQVQMYKLGKILSFQELPKPLLKQIK